MESVSRFNDPDKSKPATRLPAKKSNGPGVLTLTPRREGDVVVSKRGGARNSSYSGDLAGFQLIQSDKPIMLGNQGPFCFYLDLSGKRLYYYPGDPHLLHQEISVLMEGAFDAGVAAERGRVSNKGFRKVRPKYRES